MAEWIKIHIPEQGTRGHPWSRKIPHVVDLLSPSPQLLSSCTAITESPGALEPTLCNKRSRHNGKFTHHNVEQPLLTTKRESWHKAVKTRPPKSKYNYLKKIFLKKSSEVMPLSSFLLSFLSLSVSLSLSSLPPLLCPSFFPLPLSPSLPLSFCRLNPGCLPVTMRRWLWASLTFYLLSERSLLLFSYSELCPMVQERHCDNEKVNAASS